MKVDVHVRVAAITGGRYVDPYSRQVLIPSDVQLLELWTLLFLLNFNRVVHGAAIGTDQSVARFLSMQHRDLIDIAAYPVDCRLDGEWPLAGHRRNRRMLIESAAETLFALPGHTGTTNCVNQAISLGRAVYTWVGNRSRGTFQRIH